MLIDQYHHLFETFISILTPLNKRIIINIFTSIVVPALTNKGCCIELKLYLLRLAEKTISLAGGDVPITPYFLTILFRLGS